jgi:putative phosphonate metabolism protein
LSDRSSERRFAVYFAPAAGSPLAKAGASWLGRDALSDMPLSQPRIEGLPAERLGTITASPRHYGFHATLKAPFSLIEDATVSDLEEVAAGLAARRSPFFLDLAVGELSGFLALVPAQPSAALAGLEAGCVKELDRFRAPDSEAELQARRAAGLSARQEALLAKWGYPYVLDEFRFHMTLSKRLDEPERGRVKALLQDMFGPVLEAPVTIDSLSIFEQPERSAPFVETARYPLRG